MKITYDKKAKAVYIYLSKEPIDHTAQYSNVMIDLDKFNYVVGIEIIYTSKPKIKKLK